MRFKFKENAGKGGRPAMRRRRPDTSCHTYHATPAIVDALIALDRRDPNARQPYSPAIVNRRIVR